MSDAMPPEAFDHYQTTLGNIPLPISQMFGMDESFASHYTSIRRSIYLDRPAGLSTAVKELMLVLLDLAVSNTDGAINHLGAAKRAGCTQDQLHEMLLIAFLVLGVSGWGKTGHVLWERFPSLE